MSKPLWKIADDLALAELLGGFKETARSAAYGPYGWVGDSRMNRRTHDAIIIAGHLTDGWGAVEFSQGGLNNNAVDASAATHNGLDVADVRTRGHSLEMRERFCANLMLCGQVGFIRGVWDNMDEHMHVVDMIAENAHPDARQQIYAPYWGYVNGGAGLEGAKAARWHGPERGPILDWDDSKYNPKNGWRP